MTYETVYLVGHGDSDVSKVSTWQGTPHVAEVGNKCRICVKNYMSNHVAQCVGNKTKKLKVMHRYAYVGMCRYEAINSFMYELNFKTQN